MGYGPLGGATPVPNPLLPIEYFNHKGIVDPFIAKLNSDSKYSLLNNKKTYTVRIATFSGDTSMKKNSDSFVNAVPVAQQGSLAPQEDDGALIAVIAAAVSAYREQAEPAAAPGDFVVRKIRRIGRK